MTKYRLRPEFMEIALGMTKTVFPPFAEAGELFKELGFSSPADLSKLEEFEKWIEARGVSGTSVLAAIVGSPLGFLPFMSTMYGGGLAKKITLQAQEHYRPERLDPLSAIQGWRRDIELPPEISDIFDELRDRGWSDGRIEFLKRITEVMPTPQDLVLWSGREVFEPDAVRKYGLDDEFEKLDLSLFAKIGISKEIARNHWRAHWQHASFTQIVQMRRRGLITDEDVYEWFRLVEIPPYWRHLLADLIWVKPTRVDLRRFWDMRTIDETALREYYLALGYHDKELEDYVLWTKVYTGFPNLIARYSKGWISLDEVRAELRAMGMSETRMEELIQERVKKEGDPERMEGTRQLTRALIVKGAKLGKFDKTKTMELLRELNYGEFEAEAIFDIEIEGAESPETPLEFERVTQSYRRSVGLTAREIPQDLIDAEKALLSIKGRLEAARKETPTPDNLSALESELAVAQAFFDALLVERGVRLGGESGES